MTEWSQNPSPVEAPEQVTEEKRVVSITEAARINNVTRQAIYVAIKQKKLKATKDATRWTIDLEDLEEYRKNKYSRTKSIFDGELLFDNGISKIESVFSRVLCLTTLFVVNFMFLDGN